MTHAIVKREQERKVKNLLFCGMFVIYNTKVTKLLFLCFITHKTQKSHLHVQNVAIEIGSCSTIRDFEHKAENTPGCFFQYHLWATLIIHVNNL